MPSSQQHGRPLLDEQLDPMKFRPAKTAISFQSHGIEPELGLRVFGSTCTCGGSSRSAE
jgi:hypothetical protein